MADVQCARRLVVPVHPPAPSPAPNFNPNCNPNVDPNKVTASAAAPEHARETAAGGAAGATEEGGCHGGGALQQPACNGRPLANATVPLPLESRWNAMVPACYVLYAVVVHAGTTLQVGGRRWRAVGEPLDSR
jgi:hypothetical protein